VTLQTLKRLFTVEEYYQMARSGILSEDDRVELIEGEILEMSPIGSRHAACVRRLNQIFSARIGTRAIVSVQNPIHLSKRSEPQPDLALLQPRDDFYERAHPEPEDVLLIVEVAETSADFDRETKAPLYAQAGIPEPWLVDLSEDYIEVFRQPSAKGYAEVRQVRRGQVLCPQALPGLELAVADILG
jgi:Uma2 family endonuclease